MSSSPDATDLILSEIRSLRERFDEHTIHTEKRIATLESLVTSVVGNGRPGRLDNVEADVRRLDRWKYWLVGAGTGIGGFVTFLFEGLKAKP